MARKSEQDFTEDLDVTAQHLGNSRENTAAAIGKSIYQHPDDPVFSSIQRSDIPPEAVTPFVSLYASPGGIASPRYLSERPTPAEMFVRGNQDYASRLAGLFGAVGLSVDGRGITTHASILRAQIVPVQSVNRRVERRKQYGAATDDEATDDGTGGLY